MTAAVLLHEADVDDETIAAISGHETLAMAKKSGRKAAFRGRGNRPAGGKEQMTECQTTAKLPNRMAANPLKSLVPAA